MISLHVNGKKHEVDVAPDTPLLWVLRDNLGITTFNLDMLRQAGS